MSAHWATIGEAGALAGLRTMVWIHDHLGRTVFNIVLLPVMAYFYVRRPIARKASRDYLSKVKREHPQCLKGKPGVWMSYRHFVAFGQALMDKVVAWVQPPGGIDMHPEEQQLLFSLAEESDEGILLVGSHFGNLEYSRSIALRHPDLVINILLYDQHAANFAALITDSAPESRLNLIQVTDLDIELAIRLKEKVDNGEWVLIAGDRVPVGSTGNVCKVTFFGETADFPIGPWVLANLLHCPVYLLHCFLKQGKYHLGLEHFADEIRPSGRDKRRSYQSEAQRFASALEQQVCQEPLQWFNFYDFWREQDTSGRQTDSLRTDDEK